MAQRQDEMCCRLFRTIRVPNGVDSFHQGHCIGLSDMRISMKINERQLRSLINEELLCELFGIGEKIENYTKDALSSYFKNNADEIASGVVPGIPFDGNIVESYFEKKLAESLRENILD